MSILKIPMLEQVLTQLDTQGADLQESIDQLTELLTSVNESLLLLNQTLLDQAKGV